MFAVAPALLAAGLAYLWIDARWDEWRAPQAHRRAYRTARQIRRGWTVLAQDLGLDLRIPPHRGWRGAMGSTRPKQPVLKVPKIKTAVVDQWGVTLEFGTLAGVGMDEFRVVRKDLADAWGAVRVAIRQDKPSLVRVRVVTDDPLIAESVQGLPPYPRELDQVWIGQSDAAEPQFMPLKNRSSCYVAGVTGYGKTSFLLGLFVRLAPSDSVQMILADGKTDTGAEGDYAGLEPRLYARVGDDLADTALLLEQLVAVRKWRTGHKREVLGTSNCWDVGPTPDWPLIVIYVDECQTYFFPPPAAGSDAKTKEDIGHVHRCIRAARDLIGKGRSEMIYIIPATQKTTGDGIPTQLRDNIPVSVSFAARSGAGAVAALGEEIREYPDADPRRHQGDAYRGVGVMKTEGREGYTTFKNPYTHPEVAVRVARATAGCVRPGILTQVTVGVLHPTATAPAPAAAVVDQAGVVDMDSRRRNRMIPR